MYIKRGRTRSAGQQTLRIAEVTGMSSDNIELAFDAAIALKVIGAKKAVVNHGH